MRRVVVTGLGIVSSIGNNTEEVLTALRQNRSGLVFVQQMRELGLRCSVYGPVTGWDPSTLGKRAKLTMSTVAQYAAGATIEAIKDARLKENHLHNERTGIIVGTAFGGINEVFRIDQLMATGKSLSRAGATGVVKIMNSTASGNLAAYLGVQGRTYSISSAFSSGTDNIGHAFELIKYGLQDICICGAAEEDCWKQIGVSLDNWEAMPREWNDHPTQACRPYDRDRQGTVLTEGAGILILETLEHAHRRGARVYAEIIGYGSANDGAEMFRPTGLGLEGAIRQALASSSKQGEERIDYINGHGTGTLLGDKIEAETIRKVFGNSTPPLSSTKGLTGHGMGAAGAQEAVYTLLILNHNFIAPTVNLDNIANECAGISHVQSPLEKDLGTVMSLSVGLGGTNSCIIFRKM